MPRSIISNKVSDKLNIPHKEADSMVSAVLDNMKQGLITDNSLTIRKFGTFSVLHKKERTGRNPKTGVPAVIKARKVAAFKSSKLLKNQINQ